MSRFLKNALLLGLTLSSSSFVACSDDDDGLPSDASVHSDGGNAGHDGGFNSMDGSTGSIDSSVPDAGQLDGSSGDAGAATTLHATLTTGQEPVTAGCTPGTSATGSAVVTISPDKSTITVQVTYSGLSGAPTMAHIHYGAAGVSGGVVLPFTGSLTSPFTETLTAANYSAAQGAPATFAAFIPELEAGHAYVNLHTTACGGGEIRGQIQ